MSTLLPSAGAGTRALTVQYQKDPGGPPGSTGSSASSASTSSSGAGAAAAPAAAWQLPLSARGSVLSVAAPEWQPPAAAQPAPRSSTAALQGPAPDEWEAAAEAAWAAAGGGWEEWGEGGEDAEPVQLWEPGEPGQADPLLLLPSELTAELEGSGPSALPLPLPLGLSCGSGSGPSSRASSGVGSQGEQPQLGRAQPAAQGACRTVVVSNIHPQQRWKPAEFRRKIEDAFSCCGRVEAGEGSPGPGGQPEGCWSVQRHSRVSRARRVRRTAGAPRCCASARFRPRQAAEPALAGAAGGRRSAGS